MITMLIYFQRFLGSFTAVALLSMLTRTTDRTNGTILADQYLDDGTESEWLTLCGRMKN